MLCYHQLCVYVDGSKSRKSTQPRHSGIPVKKSSHPAPSHDDGKPAAPPPSGYQRQASGDSLEENYQEFDRNLHDLMQRTEWRGKGGAKNGSAHIEEWLRQTSKDAVPLDMLGDAPVRDISSPTFTDNSLNYSQTVSEDMKLP